MYSTTSATLLKQYSSNIFSINDRHSDKNASLYPNSFTMVFYPPSWVPKLPEVPDTVPVPDFVLDEKHGRESFATSNAPYVCGISGKKVTVTQQRDRVGILARALQKELGWTVNSGSEFDKVVNIFALNTIDVMTVNWAIHRLNGISSPASAAFSADELAYQIKDAGAQAIFTVLPLLEIALAAAQKTGIARNKIYILPIPGDDSAKYPKDIKTFDQLLKEGESLPDPEPIKWEKGQGARQVAFLCYSSGTSGLPKGVLISHRNVIANTLQIMLHDSVYRLSKQGRDFRDVALGLLPYSHIYGLIVICHVSTYRGDTVVALPKFDMQQFLSAIQTYKIVTLYIVPPIVINIVKQKDVCKKYDLSSVTSIFTGAAPLGKETAEDLQRQYPKWSIRQGYGMTESCTVVCSTRMDDVWFGSSGSLIPGYKAQVLSAEGNELTGYDQPGELCVCGPSITLGYLKNDKATKETFVTLSDGDRYLRTGDEVVVRKGPSGHEHIWVVDRIKELIKVKGLQVAPAELEAALLDHPAVADCTVIPVPDDAAGEVPKAFVVKSQDIGIEESDAAIARSIQKFIEKNKARHKWLKGGVEFVDIIPKSPSGKILRRLLKDKEKKRRAEAKARL